jgi:hypothetical protein
MRSILDPGGSPASWALNSPAATIIKGYGLRIALFVHYNNRPPEGRERHDPEFTTAQSYSIGK